MNAKKILALLLGAMMLLSLAACGAKDDDKAADMNGNNTVMTGEAKNTEEAIAMHKELMAQENALLSEKTELWRRVFGGRGRHGDQQYRKQADRAGGKVP